MTKFNLYFRMKVVAEYLAGAGSNTLARKYGIAKHGTVLLWVQRFDRFGISGLELQDMATEYSGEFKIKVINWKQQHQASLPETALHFNLSSPSTIWQWERKFDLEGMTGLNRKRGNPRAMAKHKRKEGQKRTPEQVKSRRDEDQLKQLEKENKMLRIENEFLKKLKALSQDPSNLQ